MLRPQLVQGLDFCGPGDFRKVLIFNSLQKLGVYHVGPGVPLGIAWDCRMNERGWPLAAHIQWLEAGWQKLTITANQAVLVF